MKNTRLILGVVSVLVVLAFTLSYAEEEVAWEIKGWQTNEGTLIGQAGDMFIGGGVTRGLVDSIPFGKMTYECREIWQASEAGVEFTDLCTLVDSNGDKVLITTTGTLQAWDLKFLAGTGKWEGITGGGPGDPLDEYPNLSPTVGGVSWRAKGTYSLQK